MNRSLRKLRTVTVSAFLLGSLIACQANPGPAPIEEAETSSAATTEAEETEQPAENRTNVNIGIDSFRNGFNPHLIADDTALVRDIAALVLPSTFVNGQLNTDLLVSAELVEPPRTQIAQTVRYTIDREAQWNDGTPITGSDFEYLRQSMVATPGTINSAGYYEIETIRTSGGGKIVEVDFSEPLADWQQLFDNLLPSHLLQGTTDSFSTALAENIPAAADRYMVRSIDRQRGVIVLARNDRFWGSGTAKIELLTFHEAGGTSRAGEYLRTGQSVFMNLKPTETLVDTFTLLPETQVEVSNTDRTLELTLNVNAPELGTAEQRAELLKLIDIPLVAKLAAGRSAQLDIAETVQFSGDALADFRSPLQIAVDPADDQAVAAGRAIVDQLARAGISASTITTDIASALEAGISVDAIISWTKNSSDPLSLASRYRCETSLSRWCDLESEMYLNQIVAGESVFDPAWGNEFNAVQAISLPILKETRVEARTMGIVGPTSDVVAWPGGIASAANWRKNDVE